LPQWRVDDNAQTENMQQAMLLVQKTLRHSDISSTVRYAHVLDEDVRDGLEALLTKNPLIGHNSGKFRRR
jgi:protease II